MISFASINDNFEQLFSFFFLKINQAGKCKIPGISYFLKPLQNFISLYLYFKVHSSSMTIRAIALFGSVPFETTNCIFELVSFVSGPFWYFRMLSGLAATVQTVCVG